MIVFLLQKVSLVLPNCSGSIPESIANLLKDSDFYRLDNFDLKVFLNREFIEGFVKKGKFTALSWDPRNDVGNCYAVTADGKLVLSIDKELYQSLGLEGQKSVGNSFKNIIRIDLKHPDLRNDKPYFQRVKRALENEAFTNQSLQFTWDPSDSSICPSSAAAYFNSQNCTVKTCHTKVKVHRERSLRCPKYDPKSGKDVDGPHELIEYLSMRMLSCDMDRNEILNSYCESLDVEDVDTALMVHCKGFFSASFINRLWNELRKISLEPWSALCVNGFEYTPLTFFNREHTFTTNGDNNFAILHYPGNAFLLYQNSSSNKKQY